MRIDALTRLIQPTQKAARLISGVIRYMNKEELQRYCENELKSYTYEVPETAWGNSCSHEKIKYQLNQLKRAIVKPYREIFELRDTFEQMRKEKTEYKELWVVADDKEGNKVFYDDSAEEFGLATYSESGMPVTIGVRGDFVGTFMAR